MRVDLNADIGESFGIYQAGHDDLLVRVITSGSVACGFHAGDPSVMRRTVALAAKAGVAIGIGATEFRSDHDFFDELADHRAFFQAGDFTFCLEPLASHGEKEMKG